MSDEEQKPPEPNDNQQFMELLSYLKQTRGFDFTGYKPASLMRRVQKRLQQVQVRDFDEYLDYLQVHPQEVNILFNTILINVTSFFRDPAAWEYIRDTVIPRTLAEKAEQDLIRVWCAGVASGEEAYTVALLLAEAVGTDAFRERVKIYATDVDEDALSRARQGTYDAREMEGVSEELRTKYFERINDHFTFSRDLRHSLIFGRHDLLQDPPIPRIDLLVCRNTLMYFNSEAQGRILTRFNFALAEHGFLFLGRAEMLFTHANLFQAVDLKRRVFAKSPKADIRDNLMMMMRNSGEEMTANHVAKHVRFREAAFDIGPVPHLVVDMNGFLALANEPARALFGLGPRDLGRPFYDLALPHRFTRLRSAMQQALAERRIITLDDLGWETATGEMRFLDTQITPLVYNGHNLLGLSLSFRDVTAERRLQEEYEHTSEELETSFEELQSTNEELETTNEELQSTVEELETTNEELQSANEELETMNEEQQAMNEELQTVNDELRRRTTEVDEANQFLESILSSMHAAVVVLNRDMQVRLWNRRAEDMWGLRADEVVGQNFLSLDIGLPVDQLMQNIRGCINEQPGEHEVAVNATNRRGKAIKCIVLCMPLLDANRGPRGAVVFMNEASLRTPITGYEVEDGDSGKRTSGGDGEV